MEFEKMLKVLINPIYLRIFIILIAFILLFRNVLYLVLGDMQHIFSARHHQYVIDLVFDEEIPALIMTILWPIVLASLNLIHEKVRLQKDLFISVLLIHASTCLIAAYIVFDGGCYEPYCVSSDFYRAIIGGSILTLCSVIISYWIYSRPTLFVEHTNRPGE